MKKVALILGSNIADGRNYLLEALPIITKKIGVIIKKSSVYSSPPWGYHSKNDYKNQVLIVESSLLPLDVLHTILSIETSLGRIRNPDVKVYEDRTLDIDILLIDDLILQEETLEVPHPRMHLRKFCLLPLAEIMPNWEVPTFNKTVMTLLEECTDDSDLKIISGK